MSTPLTPLVDFLRRNPTAAVRFAELTFKPCLGQVTKYPGDYHIVRSKGLHDWIGRLGKDGMFYASKLAQEEWLTTLATYAVDPVAHAKEYAEATGNCSFCGLQLTDERSVSVGYGPICAEKFGLPWGEAQPEPTVEVHFKPEAQARWMPVATNAVVPLNWLQSVRAHLAVLTEEIDRIIEVTTQQCKQQEEESEL